MLSRFERSSSKQHRNYRDGDGTDLSPNGNSMVPTNGEWVAGMYHQAFRFGVADATELRVDPNPLFDLQHVTMMSWVRPLHYDAATDRAIIMNKERSYECKCSRSLCTFLEPQRHGCADGLEDSTGALQAAFEPGCWRWWGNIRVSPHDIAGIWVTFFSGSC